MLDTNDIHYRTVSTFYANKQAQRSGQEYIRHIIQGLIVLNRINSNEQTMKAFCIHPIVQEDNALLQAVVTELLKDCDPTVVALAMEYRAVANSYLSHHPFRTTLDLGPLQAVKEMLIADKIQNSYDLNRYNQQDKDFYRLNAYFNSWMIILEITKEKYDFLTRGFDL